MKEVYTTTGLITFGDDGILRIKIREGARITAEDLKNHARVTALLTENKKVKVLIDACANYTMTPEARRFSSTVSNTRIATALVIPGFLKRSLQKLISFLVRTDAPFRVFSNESDAVKWLHGR